MKRDMASFIRYIVSLGDRGSGASAANYVIRLVMSTTMNQKCLNSGRKLFTKEMTYDGVKGPNLCPI